MRVRKKKIAWWKRWATKRSGTDKYCLVFEVEWPQEFDRLCFAVTPGPWEELRIAFDQDPDTVIRTLIFTASVMIHPHFLDRVKLAKGRRRPLTPIGLRELSPSEICVVNIVQKDGTQTLDRSKIPA